MRANPTYFVLIVICSVLSIFSYLKYRVSMFGSLRCILVV
jgi:hypothetical protein